MFAITLDSNCKLHNYPEVKHLIFPVGEFVELAEPKDPGTIYVVLSSVTSQYEEGMLARFRTLYDISETNGEGEPVGEVQHVDAEDLKPADI